MGRYFGLINQTKAHKVSSYWKGSPPGSDEMKIIADELKWDLATDVIESASYCDFCRWDPTVSGFVDVEFAKEEPINEEPNIEELTKKAQEAAERADVTMVETRSAIEKAMRIGLEYSDHCIRQEIPEVNTDYNDITFAKVMDARDELRRTKLAMEESKKTMNEIMTSLEKAKKKEESANSKHKKEWRSFGVHHVNDKYTLSEKEFDATFFCN